MGVSLWPIWKNICKCILTTLWLISFSFMLDMHHLGDVCIFHFWGCLLDRLLCSVKVHFHGLLLMKFHANHHPLWMANGGGAHKSHDNRESFELWCFDKPPSPASLGQKFWACKVGENLPNHGFSESTLLQYSTHVWFPATELFTAPFAAFNPLMWYPQIQLDHYLL